MRGTSLLLEVLLSDSYSCPRNLDPKNWDCKNNKEDSEEEQELHKENKTALKNRENKEEEKRWLTLIKKHW